MQKTIETQLARELSERYPKQELVSSIKLIREQNLELFPDLGSVRELKRQQFILEQFEYVIQKLQEARDN